jgi:putative hydrolase of the HAD superfamily
MAAWVKLTAMEPKALLFDFGNTLAFVDYPALAQALAPARPGLDAQTLERAEYEGRQALDHALAADPGISLDIAYALYFRRWMGAARIYGAHLDWCQERFTALNRVESLWRVVRPGTREALAEFRRQGFRLAVVSNAVGNIEADAARFGLAPFFDVIIDSHVVGVAKPDPRIFQLALQRLGVAPQEALFAGDMYSIDMLGARSAGIAGKLVDVLGLYHWVEHIRIRGIHEFLLETG